MKKIMPFLALVLAMSSSVSAFAESKDYVLVRHEDGTTGVTFLIGYSAGTHHGRATDASGSAVLGIDPVQSVNAKFIVPIDSMTTGNEKRDCHMKQSLGLDYALSRFPREHVCNDQFRLPSTGPDSIAFPNIEFELLGWKPTSVDAPNTLVPGATLNVLARGRWTMHGQTKEMVSEEAQDMIPLQLSIAEGMTDVLRVKGSFMVSLNDYGIVVKPLLLITTRDKAKVTLDLLLAPKPLK